MTHVGCVNAESKTEEKRGTHLLLLYCAQGCGPHGTCLACCPAPHGPPEGRLCLSIHSKAIGLGSLCNTNENYTLSKLTVVLMTQGHMIYTLFDTFKSCRNVTIQNKMYLTGKGAVTSAQAPDWSLFCMLSRHELLPRLCGWMLQECWQRALDSAAASEVVHMACAQLLAEGKNGTCLLRVRSEVFLSHRAGAWCFKGSPRPIAGLGCWLSLG